MEKRIKWKKCASYQLRKAGGIYWLIDMEQAGVPFEKPIPLNELGADVWRMLEQGQKDGIVEKLCQEYQIGREQAAQDVEQFLADLSRRGISV